jgi:hypothetical protein
LANLAKAVLLYSVGIRLVFKAHIKKNLFQW